MKPQGLRVTLSFDKNNVATPRKVSLETIQDRFRSILPAESIIPIRGFFKGYTEANWRFSAILIEIRNADCLHAKVCNRAKPEATKVFHRQPFCLGILLKGEAPVLARALSGLVLICLGAI
jgi:hypothetical protein